MKRKGGAGLLDEPNGSTPRTARGDARPTSLKIRVYPCSFVVQNLRERADGL